MVTAHELRQAYIERYGLPEPVTDPSILALITSLRAAVDGGTT